MNEITITLTQQEAFNLISIIGELPTKTNAHPIYVKMAEQYNAQEIATLPKENKND